MRVRYRLSSDRSQEGAGDLEQVRSLIREGKLAPTDLVDLGSGWQMISTRAELADLHASHGPGNAPELVFGFAVAATFIVAMIMVAMS